MVHPFVHPVTCCWVLLGVVAQSLILVKRLGTCKRTQHCWPATPNIVGCYMVHPFVHPVTCCWVLLGVVAQSLILVKRLGTCKRTQQLPTMWSSNFGSCCRVRLHVAWQKCALLTVDRFYSRWGIWLPWCSHIPSDWRRYPNALCASARNKFCSSSGKHCPYSKKMP